MNIGFSNDGYFQSAEMKIMHSNDDQESSSIHLDITTENEKVDSTCLHIFCDEDTGRKSLTWRETMLKAVRIFSRRLIEYFWRSIVNGFSSFFFLLSWTAKEMLSAYFSDDIQYPKTYNIKTFTNENLIFTLGLMGTIFYFPKIRLKRREKSLPA